MDPYALTAAEVDRYERAINKIRRELFRLRTPAQSWVSREVTLPARVAVLVDLSTGKRNRTVTYGGLEYLVTVPMSERLHRASVVHWEADQFLLWFTHTLKDRPATYTQFALTVPFSRLADRFCECLDAIAEEARASWARTQQVGSRREDATEPTSE